MPKDDGSIVRIEEQSVLHWVPDIGYVHYAKVCNRTNTPKEVYVQSNPYTTNKDGEQEKVEDDKGEYATLAANECKWFTFNFGDQKITQYYTDVYKAEDGDHDEDDRYHYIVGTPPGRIRTVICNASARPQQIHDTVAIAYPRSLEASDGEELEFQVTGIHGLREDWELLATYPKVGDCFSLYPNQKSMPFTVEIAVHEKVPPQTITDVCIDVCVVGKKPEPPFAWTIVIPMVCKHEPPTLVDLQQRLHRKLPRLMLECEVEDSMSLLELPYIRYSEDEGASWRNWKADVLEIIESTKYGFARARFGIQIPMRGRDATILASIVLRDLVGNESPLPIRRFGGERSMGSASIDFS